MSTADTIVYGHTTKYGLGKYGLGFQHRLVEDVQHSCCGVVWICHHADYSFAMSYRTLMSKALSGIPGTLFFFSFGYFYSNSVDSQVLSPVSLVPLALLSPLQSCNRIPQQLQIKNSNKKRNVTAAITSVLASGHSRDPPASD